MNGLTLNGFQRPDAVHLAAQLEALLVAGDLRGMGSVRASGYRDYLMPAVQILLQHRQRVAIVSGFPVHGHYETDGPAGAIALAHGLRALGAEVALLGTSDYAEALAQALPSAVVGGDRLADAVVAVDRECVEYQLSQFVHSFDPTLVIFIEVPGAGTDGRYRNMRFEDISNSTLPWESLLPLLRCPTLAIADGGNELGMGCIQEKLAHLPVACATAVTDALVIADVSNWGAYGMLALASVCIGKPLLTGFDLTACLDALVNAGMVDGVTRCAVATEDGLPLVRSLSFVRGVQAMASELIVNRRIQNTAAAVCAASPDRAKLDQPVVNPRSAGNHIAVGS